MIFSTLLLLFSGATPLTARSQLSTPPSVLGAEETPGAGAKTAERCIVRLVDGTTLRAPTRVDGGVAVYTGGLWRLIPASEVLWLKPESELLYLARERSHGIPVRAFAARAELAGWMVDHGLDSEALAELDGVLRLAPDERHALALISMNPPRVGLEIGTAEGRTAELLRAGARLCGIGASPTTRELVVRELRAIAQAERLTRADPGAPRTTAEDARAILGVSIANKGLARPSERTLHEALLAELTSGVTTRRVFATHALRRIYPGLEIGPLAVCAVLDSSLDVREGACFALRDAESPAACSAVVRALANPSARVRVRALEALGRMAYVEAVDPLIQLMMAAAPSSGSGGGPVRANLYSGLQTAYVQDFDVEIAQGASIANPIIAVLQSGVVFDVGVAGTSSVPITTEMWTATQSLVRLTGARIGADPPAWKKWWDENRERFAKPGKRMPATGSTDEH